MTGNKGDSNKNKGFAGLDELVSDISGDVENTSASQPHEKPQEPSQPNNNVTDSIKKTNSPSQLNHKASNGTRIDFKRFAIVGGIIIALGIAVFVNKKNEQAPNPVTEPLVAPGVATTSPLPQSESSDSNFGNEITEEKPPVGNGLIFNNNQIAYCVSEKIRISAMNSSANQFDNNDTSAYNAAVSDYNDRCGHYKYYEKGSLEIVRSKVEARRLSLEAEGRERIDRLHKQSRNNIKKLKYNRLIDLSSLSPEEKESIESACSLDKAVNGPAAYNNCLSRKLASLRKSARHIDLSSLSPEEKESIESACSLDKAVNGPAAYNNCLSRKLASLRKSARHIDLSSLSPEEKESIESACSLDKAVNGPAAYNNCLSRKLAALGR